MVMKAATVDLNDPVHARIFLQELEALGKISLDGDDRLEDLTDNEALDMASLVFLKCYPVVTKGGVQ